MPEAIPPPGEGRVPTDTGCAASVWRCRFAGLSLLLAGLLATSPPAAAADVAPRRVVSINLCADQMLLALADPEQIASLSVYSTDPELSYYADAAHLYRHSAANAESVIALQPDLVLAGSFTSAATREMLKQLGYRVVDLDTINTVDEAIRQVTEVAALLGHPERGAALADLIIAARAQAERPHTRVTAAIYQRRGYMTGAESLATDLLRIVGIENVGGELAGRFGGFVSLERLVTSPPDFLVVAETDPEVRDQGVALLEHPALADVFPPSHRIELPDRLTVCAGPSLPEAIRFILAEARRIGL